MAVKDVKLYYNKMFKQYLEMKNDIADFEQAFKDGFITEDKLEDVKNDVAKVEENYNRLSYIMYLLEIPNRSNKKERYKQNTKKVIDYLDYKKATEEAVSFENQSTLKHLINELEALTKKESTND